ncbi:hypothetical protein J4212_02635, partial [Candidatus Woesearchaeota archaeon]|nr:hypothetical protein [Candidatus Woesearchaeota archaeon]
MDQIDAEDTSFMMSIYDGAADYMQMSVEGESNDDNPISAYTILRSFDNAALNTPFSLRSWVETNSDHDLLQGSVFAINLGVFESYTTLYETAKAIPGALGMIASINHTPARAGNTVVFANYIADTNDAASGWEDDITIDGTINPVGWDWTAGNIVRKTPHDATDLHTNLIVSNISIAADGSNITLRSADLTSNLGNADELSIVAFSQKFIDLVSPGINASANNSAPKVNEDVNITANISDAGGLGTCQFFMNGTSGGSFIILNKSASGTNDQCSQNFTIGLIRGNVINFTVIVNDTSINTAGGNANRSQQIITVANTLPIFPHGTSINNSNPLEDREVRIGANATEPADNDAISMVIFSWNGSTGAWVNLSNSSVVNLMSINYTVEATIGIEAGNVVGYVFYANDSGGGFGSSGISTFDVAFISPPNISSVGCDDGGGYEACSGIGYGDTLTSVRARCNTTSGGIIRNITFILTNIQDNNQFFNVNVSNSYNTYYNYSPNLIIDDSGDFNLKVLCYENPVSENDTNWSISFGTLSAQLVSPAFNANVTKNRFFNFTAQVSCSGGECGFVNATLDPPGDYNETIAFEGFESADFGIFGTTSGAVVLADAGGGINPICGAGEQQGSLPNVQSGSYAIEFASASACPTGGQIEAEINATNFTNIAVNFSWSASDTEPPDAVTFWASINNSGTYEQIWSIIPRSNGPVTLPYNSTDTHFVLDDVMSQSPSTAHSLRLKFNFTVFTGTSSDEFYIDNFNVSGLRISGSSSSSAKGAVSTTEGDTPFYTIMQNPMTASTRSCLANMSAGDICNVTWIVNSTGSAGTTWEFFAYFNSSNQTIPGIGAESGALTGTYTASGGTFSNATANDTSYWFVGESGTGTTVTAFAEMTYQLNRIPPESINNLSLDLVYCHSGDVFPDVGCNGVPVSGLVNFDGDQNVSIFDFSSGKWALIGLLDTTSGGNEIKGTFSSSSVFSNYVNASSNEVKLKVTAYFTTVIPGDNAFLVIDMANLTVGVKGYNLSAETSKVNLTIVDNTAPAAEYANIYPTVTATDGESLKCSFYIYDALSDQVTANVSWYNGDALGYSEVVSVDKFVEVNRTLSPANTTDGELWKCGVTPSDWDLTGMQVNSSAVLVVSSQPPAVNSVQCSENGIAFGSCSGITFGDTLAAARATCEDSDGYPTNITFNVTNLEDAKSFASGNATLNASGGVFTFDFADFTVQDSGTFNVTALCIDNNATQGRNHSSWSIPWGTLSASLIRPASNKNVTQLVFFNFTSTVTCSGGECGFVNATIDPETAADLEDPFESVEIGAINLNNPPPLEIMNKKEFIKDNEIWSVDFKTEGTSDLLITSPNARWTEILSDNLSTHNEMKFLELACGSTNLNNGIKIIDSENQVYYYNKIKNNDSIKIQKLLYENYNCEDTGHIRNKVIVPGYATLQLEFAGVTDFAEDPANNVNISQPDAAAPGMNVVVQFVGDDFDASDTITVNTSDITVGPKRIYSTSGTVVVNNGRVMSVPFFISSDAPDQVVGISIAGTLIGHTFRVITPAEGSGNFTGQSGSAVIGDGTDGTRTAGGTIVLDSLIIPSGLTVTVDTTDRDSTTPGNQGYLPAIILVDGPVSIAGTLNVSGTAGSAASDTTDVGGAGGAGGPGGAGGGGGGSDANSGAIGGSGFTGGGGGGSDDGGSTSGDGGSGTGSAGNTSTASNGGIGGSAINANLTGGTGGRGNNQEGAGGGGGTGSFFGTSGTGGTVTANGAGQFGGGGGAQANVNNQEGGGGGFATAGGDAEATGGAAHGNVQLIPIAGGSGGGGGGSIEDNNGDDGGGGGGGGGGAILVYSNEYILVSNSISSIGGEGGNDAPTGDALGGAGGGGSGGAIILQSGNVTVTGSLDTSGGAGGDAAGDGGLGRARIDGLRSSDFGTGVSASNFTGPAITSVTSSQVIGKANASSIIEVWVIYGSSQSTFKGTANSSGDFRIDVSYYSGGLNYIAAFQNMSSGQLSVSGSASLSSFLPPKGVIPEGSGRPFYTISANPMIHLNRSCLANMISGQSCNTTWIVNSTGDIDFTYEFFVTYKSTNYSSNVADTNTSFVNLTIINNTAPRVISVSISPAIPATSNDLTCTFNVSDTYSDTSLTANITWYNGGMLNYSIILPVPNGEFYSHTLGSDNTSDGELWKCGVIPFDHATRGSQKNSSTVLILGTLPPITYGLQCQEDGTTWGSCASLAFNDNFTAVRVNCTDPDGFILNATFNFTNVEDGKLFFKANATFNSTDTFLYNLNDIRIRDSGRFNVTATCIDNNNTKTTNRTSWSIAWGTLATSLVAPSSAVN